MIQHGVEGSRSAPPFHFGNVTIGAQGHHLGHESMPVSQGLSWSQPPEQTRRHPFQIRVAGPFEF
jgi:hypothetical protein